MSASSGGRTRNRRGEGALLRDEIVGAAERILEREGNEEALTLRAVAREAGISAPSIYPHFADREAILDAVLDVAFERLSQLIYERDAGITDPVERLLAGCQAYVDFATSEPARYRVLFGRLRTGRPELTMPLRFDEIPEDVRHRLRAFQIMIDTVAACAASGRSASTDPFADATALWTSLHGAVLLRQFVPGFPWPDLAETVDTLVRRIVRIRD